MRLPTTCTATNILVRKTWIFLALSLFKTRSRISNHMLSTITCLTLFDVARLLCLNGTLVFSLLVLLLPLSAASCAKVQSVVFRDLCGRQKVELFIYFFYIFTDVSSLSFSTCSYTWALLLCCFFFFLCWKVSCVVQFVVPLNANLWFGDMKIKLTSLGFYVLVW